MPGHSIQELDPQECLQLLAGARVGRVVYSDGAIPVCTPVNFRLDGDEVVFRTSPRTRLAIAAPGTVVSFEIDAVDELTETGWSVLATGVAERVDDERRVRHLEGLQLNTWVDEDRTTWLRIPLTRLHGFWLGPRSGPGSA